MKQLISNLFTKIILIVLIFTWVFSGFPFSFPGLEFLHNEPVHAANDFKTQFVKINIPALSASATANAPADFDTVVTANTIVLVSGVTGHAMGDVSTSNQTPDDISVRVTLDSSSVITATRSALPTTDTEVWVLIIEYTGPASGPNEFIVRDRRVHTWTNGNTTESYGAISSVSNTADVVVFNAGVENPNSNRSHFDRGDVTAYIDGSKNVQLGRGDGRGAIESSHQVVEFTGSNWTIQTGTTTPANPAASQSITTVSAISDVWVYHNFSTDDGSVNERGHRLWLTSTSNLNVEEDSAASGTKVIRWYIIENAEINVQTGAADAQFSANTSATITGFSAVASVDRSFAWVTGPSSSTNNTHPRENWQFELSDDSTITLQRGRASADLDYRYQVVELPLGNNPNLDQIHYHWRNDDGSETTATSATSGVQDTFISNVPVNSTRRLRIEVTNTGGGSSTSIPYRLEYAEKGTICAAASGWTQVGSGGAHWEMSDSANLTDGNNTTNISNATGGVTDENTTFLTPNGGVKDTSSTTSGITLTNSQFVELEFSIKATGSATNGGEYCFRLTNSGTPLDLYTKYPQVTLQLDSDFRIQRGTTLIDGATTATITAGVDYMAPASISNAFIRITNSHMTGAGRTVGGGNQNANQVTAYISNPGNLLTSITFTRGVTSNNTWVDWEIIEYIGASGGPNEMIVRGQGATTYGSGSTTANSGAISGVVTDADMVGFITAQYTPDNGRTDYNTGISTSAWNAGSDQIDFTRGEANSIAAIVSWAAVEFTGTNWVVQRVSHTYTAAGANETSSITAVNSLSRAFIHAQKRVGAGLDTVADYGHQVWLSATNQVSFRINGSASTPSSHVSVAWVIENTQTDGNPMNVVRSNGAQSGASDGDSINVNIGTTVTSLSTTSIWTNNGADVANRSFPKPMMGVSLVSRTQYRLFISESSNTRNYRTEVVEWPNAVSSIDQAAYRWFENDDSTDVGAPYAAQDTAGATTEALEPFRLRMLLEVSGDNQSVSAQDFKLQYAERSGTCDTSFTGETYADVTGASIISFYDNATPADGATATTNVNDPSNTGNTIYQTYEEANNFSNSVSAINIGQDGLWDFSLIENGVTVDTVYCFRAVKSNDDLLESYTVIPEMNVSSGVLTVDIVDAGAAPVASPSVPFSDLTVGFVSQTTSGTLGTASEKVRITNTRANPQWSLSIAATLGSGSFWDGAAADFDFNDPTPSAADGADNDSFGGQLTIDASAATITPEFDCTSTGLTLGSSAGFSEGILDSITLVSAGGGADRGCFWDLTDVDLSQSVPLEQPSDFYDIDMTLTIVAI